MATGIRGYINNFSTTLAESISSGDTTFDITDDTGLDAILGTADYVALTIDDGTNVEIVHVTANSSGTITVDRAMEDTSAESFASGDTIELRATAASFDTGGGGGGGLWEVVESRTLGSDVSETFFEGLDGHYILEFDNVIADNGSDNVALKVQFGTGSGPVTYSTVAYAWENVTWASNFDGPGVGRASATSSIDLYTFVYRSTDRALNGRIDFGDLSNTSFRRSLEYQLRQQFVSGGVEHVQRRDGTGIWNATNAVTGVRIFVTNGTLETGSTFHLLKRTY